MTISSYAPARFALTSPLMMLLSGNGGVALLTLARNLFAARLIGLENFGIAASFAILLSTIEMATTLGAQQLIVQDPDGNSEQSLASLHCVQLARGLFGATALYLLSEPAAAFFGTPDLGWAYRTISLVPLISAFIHLDAWRYQRTQRFWPSICIQLGPAALALLLVWPLFVKFGDFRVLLVAAIAQAAGTMVMSRLVAERRYTVLTSIKRLKKIIHFGWPLALNGILLVAVFHGEKILVGHLLGSKALAVLAIGFTLTLTPALVLGRSLQSYALPQLSNCQEDSNAFKDAASAAMRLCTIAGVTLTAALVVTAPLIPVLLGDGFSAVTPLIPMLAVLHGLRVARTGISTVALAKGATGNAVIGNLPRVMALPIIYHLLAAGASLPTVLWIATAAEVVGLFLTYALLSKTLRAT